MHIYMCVSCTHHNSTSCMYSSHNSLYHLQADHISTVDDEMLYLAHIIGCCDFKELPDYQTEIFIIMLTVRCPMYVGD